MQLLSIIIPHYNNWDMLADLLESIPNHKSIEVIIVDDKSQDSTNKLNLIRDKFPDYYFFENDSPNKGAGAARNMGLLKATGKWIIFADSDDKFENDLIKKLSPYLESEYDLIYFPPGSFYSNNLIESDRHLRYSNYVVNYISDKESRVTELDIRYKFIVPWSKLIRHSVIVDNNIHFEEILVSNDILFSAKVGYFSEKINAVNQTIYSVRQREGSLTSSINNDRLLLRFNAWLDYVNFIKKKMTSYDFKLLQLSSFNFMLKALKVKRKTSLIFYIFRESKKHNIPIIDSRIFNIKKIFKLFNKKL